MDPTTDGEPAPRTFKIGQARLNTYHEDKPEQVNFQPEFEVITSSNWSKYFPETELSEQLRSRLDNGTVSIIVASDPATRERAGYIQISHDAHNQVYIETSPAYERRGVATALIMQAQARYASLTLYNFAGPVGERLYEKMGFVKADDQDLYKWNKAQF